ncbi:ABC transporter permease [Prochlorococcus marinus]|uniref:Putative iron ABC transporter n=1 Tax=Prochlorococcus marinus (strain MIT 9211) TaxID=93059 RepID=A9BEB1_PROM4|nr:iron ABC transporter permease [Prochlorococcus marinus]ABX08421.1 putative iron ABC transporter [Prochlorococcus marinus str. MIT 9211]
MSTKTTTVLNFSTQKLLEGRVLLNVIAILLSFFILWPLFGLLYEGINGVTKGVVHLGANGISQIKGTFVLVLFTSILGGILGTTNGWLLANCRFKGRKTLRLAQLLPLATPAYLLSATLIDLGSIFSIRIHGMQWGVLVMALTTYPYVFLLSTESFSKAGNSQLEACRSLGIGPWKSFAKVSLPIAMPAIGTGLALAGMEVINELGAVELLNIPSISAGIVESWISEGNPAGAIALALIALIIVLVLVAYEKALRRKSRRWSEGISGAESPAWELKGIKIVLAQIITLFPPLFTLGIPLVWAIVNIDQIHHGLSIELFALTARSLGLGIIASSLAMVIAVLLGIAKRWNPSTWMKSISFLSGIGYAIPGAVLALALLSFRGEPWNIAPFFLLLWGYSNRFLAVGKGGIDSAFERINPNIDEAASSLGSRWREILRKIHLPLLKGPITVGFLLVFVDTLKELPLTFVLRPFNFDTLSVRIFQYAGDERMGESIIPSLIILSLGLIASISLIPSLDYNDN